MGLVAAVAIGVVGLFVGLSAGGGIAGVLFGFFLFAMAYGAFVWDPETLRRKGKTPPPAAPVAAITPAASSHPAARSEDRVTRRVFEMLAPLGLPEDERNNQAAFLVSAALTDIRERGLDATSTSRPPTGRASTTDLQAQIAAGLTTTDIDDYWGRSLLAVVAEAKVREYLFFIWMNVAEQTGQDLTRAKRHFQSVFPQFLHPLTGEPEFGETTLTGPDDTPLFPEFTARVTAWHQKLGEREVDAFVAKYGSVNAAARVMIKQGQL